MSNLKENYLVTKRNVLNEMRSNNMTLQELRFFAIYLSKINSENKDTRIVRFSLSDFQAIMELGRVNINYLKTTTNSLLSKIVNIPDEKGGYEAFQLFKKCKVSTDDKGEWYIEINAHDDALPLMFDFKNRFFSYELCNALRLKSSNQLRMYELLKQYEKAKYKICLIKDLREELGIKKNEYSAYHDFKKRVLDACQQALFEKTDIKFTYEPHGKRGKGGKILALKFVIQKNESYIDPLTLDKFIQNIQQKDALEIKVENKYLEFFSDACKNEFSEAELQVLYNLVVKIVPYTSGKDFTDVQLEYYRYLQEKYDELILRASKIHIKNRFGYLKAIIEADLNCK